MFVMLRLTPFILIALYLTAMWFFSAWRLRAELARNSTPLTHPRLLPMLELLGRAMQMPPVQAHVYEVAPINGLAAPDGRIYLTRGFLDKLDQGQVSEAELASVIAHELGHVAHGHSRRRMIDFAGQNVIRLVLGTMLRFIPILGPWLAGLAVSALAARLSRQDEFEADAFATALMIKAGLGTGPQKSLFRKLAAWTGDAGAEGTTAGMTGGGPAWLRSHPPTDRRIAAIEQLEARWRVD